MSRKSRRIRLERQSLLVETGLWLHHPHSLATRSPPASAGGFLCEWRVCSKKPRVETRGHRAREPSRDPCRM